MGNAPQVQENRGCGARRTDENALPPAGTVVASGPDPTYGDAGAPRDVPRGGSPAAL